MLKVRTISTRKKQSDNRLSQNKNKSPGAGQPCLSVGQSAFPKRHAVQERELEGRHHGDNDDQDEPACESGYLGPNSDTIAEMHATVYRELKGA